MTELIPLESVGDGYYAEYFSSNKKRRSNVVKRPLTEIAPIRDAIFNPNEYAYQIPYTTNTTIRVTAEQYDVDTYTGSTSTSISMDETLEESAEKYQELKVSLVLQTFLLSFVGMVLIVSGNIPQGDPIAFALGSASGILYLVFLYVKTDTMGSREEDMGNGIAALRFLAPPLAFLGITLYNTVLGQEFRFFNSVTPSQYLSAICGFLLYRLPLFARQVGAVMESVSSSSDNNNDTDLDLIQFDKSTTGTNNDLITIRNVAAKDQQQLLLDYLLQWSQRFENNDDNNNTKSIRLTTPVQISSLLNDTTTTNNNNKGIRMIFQPTGSTYKSKKDELREEKDNDNSTNSKKTTTKKASEGGVDIVVVVNKEDDALDISVTRCNMEDDDTTIIKEMSEETIVFELKQAVQLWKKKQQQQQQS
mmetsp:Transcript_5545/g.8770  ORF Transcript_5545/g.8770 Transcript_5545/m.8770 type:complete len:419 (-) Transcript_5545:83-1339(-)